jgi:hypothetical protein
VKVPRYQFDGKQLELYVTHHDVELLSSLTGQLLELLTDGLPDLSQPEAQDPFEAWEDDFGDSAAAPEELEEFEDPALQRLFPNPYPDDPRAASDYRRYTETDARRSKVAHAQVVERILANAPPIVVPVAEVGSWLKTFNSLRLVVASRLGVDDDEAMEELQALPDDDPRAMMGAIMDWLAYLQSVIIELTDRGQDHA